MPKIDLWFHVRDFCEKGKKEKHKEITNWIEEQYNNHGFPISSLALQVNDFNEKELIQVIHWLNHKAGNKK